MVIFWGCVRGQVVIFRDPILNMGEHLDNCVFGNVVSRSDAFPEVVLNSRGCFSGHPVFQATPHRGGQPPQPRQAPLAQ